MPLLKPKICMAILTASICLLPLATVSASETTQAKAHIITPKNGDTVTSPVHIMFGLSGMGVAPAGIDKPNTGHHHLLVNAENLPAMQVAIPSDAQHRHFGGGQTETHLALTPGTYTLQLVLGDANHVPVTNADPSEKITITVK